MHWRSRLNRARLCWCSFCALAANTSVAQPRVSALPFPVASYTLHARLNTDWHQIEASGQIKFTNRSAAPISELWFHLYPEAFSSERTRFWRTENATRRNRRALYERGKLDVLELSVHGANDVNLWNSADPTTPGDPDDTTDRRVPLREPVQSGETVVFDVRFVTQLPFIVERMGWVESFHAVAQWFPKLARLEPDGTWRHYPYEALAEFYADFGDYDITVDVPGAFTVAAPGNSTVLSRDSKHTVTRFELAGAHDFALFAWDRFKCSRSSTAAVEVEICAPPGHERNVALELGEVATALPRFQTMFGAYPYRKLMVVHPPDVASPAGGMEYPGLIVTGAPWYASVTGTRALSAVTIHELAHQWFYGIVASDEARYPVLDEGLASWAELTALTDEYGPGSAFSGLGVTLSASAVAQLAGTSGYKQGPLASEAASFANFSQLAHSVYARTTLLLQTLGNVWGQDKLRSALHRYAMSNRFAHPGPQELIAAFESELGHVAASNLAVALSSDGWIDFEPTSIDTAPAGAGHWKSRVTIRRAGTLDLPVDVAVALGDARVQMHWCQFQRSECILELRTDAPVASITVDPHRRIALESRCSNNTLWHSTPPKPTRLFERLVYAAQLVLGEFIL